MFQSKLFYKAKKEFPKDEESINAKYLIRAGFIEKLSSGVYEFLPLGFRVLEKITDLVRKEMLSLNAQELLLPALHPKENWLATQRWEKFDALFKLKSRTGSEYALGPTHEEIIFPLVKEMISSYKDLPLALFQIQTKFRDELRAKAGLLRGREFLMKDLYSFHKTNEEVEKFKEKVDRAYLRIFKVLGLKVYKTFASGGTFSKYSTEFQVPTEFGEDEILICSNCKVAWNKEIKSDRICNFCKEILTDHKAIEVGNTFNLGDSFSKSFDLKFKDKDGKEKYVFAGCYGLGISRLMGAIVEVFHDDRGIIWPEKVAPFTFHILILKKKVNLSEVESIVKIIEKLKKDYLLDERNISFGQKLVESDLIGIPYRLVLSERLKNMIEFKERKSEKVKLLKISELFKFLKEKLKIK